MWEDYEPGIKVVEFPEVNTEILKRYKFGQSKIMQVFLIWQPVPAKHILHWLRLIPFDQVGEYDSEIIAGVKSLAKREIIRMKDFYAIAENPFDSDSLIAEIQRSYAIESDTAEEYV